MGNDSAYYREKSRKTREKVDCVKDQLPHYTHEFIESCLLAYQINTVYVYIHDLLMFFTFLQERNPLCQNKDIKDISFDVICSLNASDINEFQNYLSYGGKLSRKGENPRAIARKMASVRNYFKFLEQMDYIDHNPTSKAAKKQGVVEDEEIYRLDPDEAKQLIDAVSNVFVKNHHSKVLSEMTAKRDLAIIMLLLGTGIRVSECAGIDLADVNFSTNTISIVRKGGKSTDIYMSEIVRNALRDYINNERSTLLPEGVKEDALFISLKHSRLSVRSIQYMVEKYGKNLNLKKALSPHKLRKTYGTALYNKTGDIYMVADALGHKDVNTTVKHYAAIEEEHKKQAAQVDIYGLNQDLE